jgi:hypothetical protein
VGLELAEKGSELLHRLDSITLVENGAKVKVEDDGPAILMGFIFVRPED